MQLNRPRKTACRIFLSLAFLAGYAECHQANAADSSEKNGDCLVYIGTYTGEKSKGIYAWRMNLESGTLTPAGLVAETPSPSFLEIVPQRHLLYAVNETEHFDGKDTGAVTAFAIDPATGKLTQLNQRSSLGTDPCYILADRKGRDVMAANYTSGNFAVWPIQAGGSLGEPTAFFQDTGRSINERQAGPHAHCVTLDARNRFAFICDLGLDKVMVYHFDSSAGTLTPNDPPFVALKPGSGPRHLKFSPNGRYAYVINELGSTVTVFTYDSRHGRLKEVQTISTLPADFTGANFPAELEIDAAGKFLYASNRGRNSIAVFAIDHAQGTLTPVQDAPTQGNWPRDFRIDPTGHYLLVANQKSDNVIVFSVDPNTGKITPTGQSLEVASPACVKFLPVASQ